jgi:hypothetical protein
VPGVRAGLEHDGGPHRAALRVLRVDFVHQEATSVADCPEGFVVSHQVYAGNPNDSRSPWRAHNGSA